MVDEFLAEVLQQNWRVDLDAGLGVEDPGFEAILVVCAPDVTSQLLERCCKGQSEQPLAGTLSAIHIEGTQAGEPAEWDKLRKRIAFIGQPAVPGKDLSMELATK